MEGKSIILYRGKAGNFQKYSQVLGCLFPDYTIKELVAHIEKQRIKNENN